MIVFDQLKKSDPHLRLLTLVVLIGMAILITGLWWVQIISHRHFSEDQKAQSFRTVRIPAIRGKILDRNGVALAENRPSYNVILYVDELRSRFRNEWSRTRPRGVRLRVTKRRALQAQARYRVVSNSVRQVAEILQYPVDLSFHRFMKHYTNQLALPLTVLSELTEEQVARLLESPVNPPGIDLEIIPTRHYPGGQLAAHLLGYLVRDNRSMEGEVADFNFRLTDYRGHAGIESEFDGELRGKAGVKSVLVNAMGFRQSETVWAPAEPGKNVILTLNAAIQQSAEEALNAVMTNTRGAVVVMDPHNGDILAMASAPAFDPNSFIPRISLDEWKRLSDEKLKPQINRAMQENYAPGSVFKVVTGLAALEAGLDPKQEFYNPGRIYVRGRRRPINDLATAGNYDFVKAFIKSSNTYFITNGIMAGIERIATLGHRLHLGERTGLMNRQETGGIFPSLVRVRQGWRLPDTANLCIGQGYISVTPVQIAVMIAAVANGGKVLWPRLTQRVEPADPHSNELVIDFPPRPPRDNLGVSERSLRITREAMLADVAAGGTGRRALVSGMRIGGKTGTAQITNPQNVRIGNTAWFASCAPFEAPRYVVVVMVEGDLGMRVSGGGTCAPVAQKIYQTIQKLDQQGHPTVVQNN